MVCMMEKCEYQKAVTFLLCNYKKNCPHQTFKGGINDDALQVCDLEIPPDIDTRLKALEAKVDEILQKEKVGDSE